MRPRAYGIVRLDLAPVLSDVYVAGIRALALEQNWELRAVFKEPSDSSYPLLMATLGLSGISAVAVPSTVHLGVWLTLVRESADVWTLHPPRRWPRSLLEGATR